MKILELFGRKKSYRAWLPVAYALEEIAYGICMKADIRAFMVGIDRLSTAEKNAYIDWAQPKLVKRAKEQHRKLMMENMQHAANSVL